MAQNMTAVAGSWNGEIVTLITNFTLLIGALLNFFMMFLICNHLKRCPYRYSSHCGTFLPAVIISDSILCLSGFLYAISIYTEMRLIILKIRCSFGTFFQFFSGFLVAWYLTILSSGIKNFSTPVLVFKCRVISFVFGMAIIGLLGYYHCFWLMGISNNTCTAISEWEPFVEWWRRFDFFFADFIPYSLMILFGMRVAFKTFKDWIIRRRNEWSRNICPYDREAKMSTFIHKPRVAYPNQGNYFYETMENCWFSSVHIRWALPIFSALLQMPLSIFILYLTYFPVHNPEQLTDVRKYLTQLSCIGHSFRIVIFVVFSSGFRKDFTNFLRDLHKDTSDEYNFLATNQGKFLTTPNYDTPETERRRTESSVL